jgi:tRNA uridine 5-carboxymethylaminomethyl modification enzyme
MSYDVAVVGGGHAACEAALAAARMGAKTILFTINLDHVAQMSCNPAIGGIAKGHVVREIDAMGGAMGSVTDAASLQFRMLNMAKGPAVWSPRAQCDKYCYHQCMNRVLELQENLTIRNATVMGFLLEDGKIAGVETFPGGSVKAKAVVVATGTFLNGKMHYGLKNMSGGRSGDPASIELADAFRTQLGLKVGRLKTGTPPRILGSSIDFSKMGTQNTDEMEEHFSYFSPIETGF